MAGAEAVRTPAPATMSLTRRSRNPVKVGSEMMTSQEQAAYFTKHGRAPVITTTEMLPERYKKVETSDLKAEVIEGAANDFAFDLVD